MILTLADALIAALNQQPGDWRISYAERLAQLLDEIAAADSSEHHQ